jgi:putative thioredoxin
LRCAPGIVLFVIDVTDATFEQDVLVRSEQVPVVVDLWAPWCGPCRTLGPILEKVVEAKGGSVELVKVNVDENPRISTTFQVQSIPAVFALKDRQVVDGFIGAVPEPQVTEFVDRLAPQPSEADALVAAGDEASLRRALDLEPDHPGAVVALARMLLQRGEPGEALQLVARVPETPEVRQVAAEARLSLQQVEVPADGVDVLLDSLLTKVKADEAARQEFLDLLETLGPDDPRTSRYRKALATQLF